LFYNDFNKRFKGTVVQSDFHVHFPPETVGLLAHMANEKNMDITILITELTIEGLKSERKDFGFKIASENVDIQESWSMCPNKFDESEWTWPGL
jgi:hypothetical protein